jgi:hypothetical protein
MYFKKMFLLKVARGRLKYNQQLLKKTLAEVEEVKLMLHTIFAGLKGSFNFEQSLIERIACEDEVDRKILQALFEAGSPSLLPKDLAAKPRAFKVCTQTTILFRCENTINHWNFY